MEVNKRKFIFNTLEIIHRHLDEALPEDLFEFEMMDIAWDEILKLAEVMTGVGYEN